MLKSLRNHGTTLLIVIAIAVAVSSCSGGSGKNLMEDLVGRRVESFDVEGNWAAYLWWPNGGQTTPQHIVLRDLSSGNETEIATGDTYSNVVVDSGIVAYVKRGTGGDPSEIVAYTMNGGATQTIASGRVSSLDAGGGRAVWEDLETNMATIGSLAGGGGAPMDSSEGVFDIMPCIGTTHAAWVRDDRNAGVHRLMVYDVAAGSTTATDITSDGRFVADVSGNKVVYCKYGEPEDEIHVYDIASRADTVIASSPRIKDSPRIEGNYVAWTEHIPAEEFGGVAGQPLFDEQDFRNLMRHDLSSDSTKELAHNVFGLSDPVPMADGTVYARAPRGITPPGQSNTGDVIDIREF